MADDEDASTSSDESTPLFTKDDESALMAKGGGGTGIGASPAALKKDDAGEDTPLEDTPLLEKAPVGISLSSLGDFIRSQNSEQWAWSLLDMGTFGCKSVGPQSVFPVMFKELARPMMKEHEITMMWGVAMGVSNGISMALSTCFGAFADITSTRKACLLAGACISVIGTLLVALTDPTWQLFLTYVVITGVGITVSTGMYNSLIVYIFPVSSLHMASCTSTCFGNAGSGLAILAMLMYMHGSGDESAQRQFVLLAGCGWDVIFLLNFLVNVKEPEPEDPDEFAEEAGLFGRISNTLCSDDERLSAVRWYIVANLLLCEGSGMVFTMASIDGLTKCGVSPKLFYAANVGNRFFGAFFSLVWGLAVTSFGIRSCYLLVGSVMMAAAMICVFMSQPWHYLVLMLILSLAGSGSFSLGRSLLASLVPLEKASELFGINSLAGDVGGVLGPFLFAITTQLTGHPAAGFLAAVVFIGMGMAVFLTIPKEAFRGSSASPAHAPQDVAYQPTARAIARFPTVDGVVTLAGDKEENVVEDIVEQTLARKELKGTLRKVYRVGSIDGFQP